MNLDEIKIGKIKNMDKQNGVGEIVTIDDIYTFTIDNLKDKNVENGDLVKFRGEKINDKNMAFFVNKIDETYELKHNPIKSKIYNSDKN